MTSPMCGILPILVTPFDDHGHVDEDSLRQLVDYNIQAGVHGLGIALGSEIVKLLEAERTRVLSVVVEQTRGRVPIVVNTGAQANHPAVFYSQQAQEAGAAAVMATPPAGSSPTETCQYFKAISDAVRIPVFIQDTGAVPVSAALMRRIAEECEQVYYSKVESAPPPQKVFEAVRDTKGCLAIFGGAGGAFFLEELRRGSVGTMPWPSTPHAFVQVWNHWQAGEENLAIGVFEREIAPLTRLASTTLGVGHQVHKEILRRKGIIQSAHVRGPADPLDAITLQELDLVCERLKIGR